ncbi:MAG: glycoside hydrolase family 38 C-terminal domain-containing protein, partial [Clostridia bacterium]
GLTFGTRRAEWVKTPHHYMVDNILAEQAEGGERFHLLFEVYAGHFFPDVGGCATGPVLPGSFADPLEEGKRATVGHSSVGEWCEDAYQLMMDVETLDQLMHCMDATSLRAAKIAEGLEAYTRTVDFEQDAAGRDADYRAARELLHPLMHASNGSTAPRFCAVGNAHLDLAWLWPMAETHRKTARTFAQQLRLLERYPEYKFIQSQPASYEMCREHYPELYERIRAAIKRGQWIADGAMYVEPDTNMASGEALIRQLVHGKRFYRDELGVDSKVLWLPDTFGYTAALPQILRGCGVNYLVTQKIFWSYNEGDQFPYHYFTWKGMDGSAVTSFLPTSYTYDTKPEELYGVWKNRVQTRDLDAFFVPFGYGDGGGGPTRDHVEYALRERDLEGMPKLEMMGPQQFFEEMEKEGAPKNTWDGELYFSAHRGTYTSQAKVKKNNRLSELALREAELWGALAEKRGHAYPLAEMDRLWKVLLLHQFHDILPGSSIARVYVEANQAHAKLQAEAVEIAQAAREQLVSGDGLTVFNSLSFPRKALVKLPASFGSGAKTLEGETVPVLDGVAIVELPPMGVVALLPGEAALEAPRAVATLTATGAVLENELVKAVLNELGEVVSFVRKETGREFVAQPMNRMLMYKDVPRLFDAWDIDSNYIEQPVELARKAELSVVCAGGAKAVLKLRRELDGSVLEQEITLSAIGERLDFVTNVDWHELHRLLKVSFTGTPRSNEAIHEMQFGYVKRPTHRSRAYDKDRFEVCNHRYTALCDESHGFAVLNNCKYGVSVNG